VKQLGIYMVQVYYLHNPDATPSQENKITSKQALRKILVLLTRSIQGEDLAYFEAYDFNHHLLFCTCHLPG